MIEAYFTQGHLTRERPERQAGAIDPLAERRPVAVARTICRALDGGPDGEKVPCSACEAVVSTQREAQADNGTSDGALQTGS